MSDALIRAASLIFGLLILSGFLIQVSVGATIVANMLAAAGVFVWVWRKGDAPGFGVNGEKAKSARMVMAFIVFLWACLMFGQLS